MKRQLTILLLLLAPIMSAWATEVEVTDTLATDTVVHKRHWPPAVQKVIDYFANSNRKPVPGKFDFSIIGGPHYSSDTKLGLGIVAAGLYYVSAADSLMMPSNVSVYGDISTVGYYMLGVRGTNIFPRDRMRLVYDLYFYSFRTKFWGIGYESESNKANETNYNDFTANASAELLFNLKRGLYIGPEAEINYSRATHVTDSALWNDERLRVLSPGVGFTFQYDTRDHLSAPYSGMLAIVKQRFYPAFMGNKSAFSSTEIGFNWYHRVWKGGVIATRLHGRWAYGNVPWNMLSKLGDGASMRGYYKGRYRDKAEADLTVELRQHIWRRNGAVFWVGAGTVAPSPAKFRFNHILPNAGVGYRWEFKERTNVRIDVGVGKGEWGFVFNINEAF